MQTYSKVSGHPQHGQINHPQVAYQNKHVSLTKNQLEKQSRYGSLEDHKSTFKFKILLSLRHTGLLLSSFLKNKNVIRKILSCEYASAFKT